MSQVRPSKAALCSVPGLANALGGGACQLRAALRAERALLRAGAAVARAHARLRAHAPEGGQAAEEVRAGEAHHGEELHGAPWLRVLWRAGRVARRAQGRALPTRSCSFAAGYPALGDGWQVGAPQARACRRERACTLWPELVCSCLPAKAWAAPTSSRLFCSGVPVSRIRRLARSASSESMVLLPPADLRRCPSSQTCRAAAAPLG